MGLPVPPIVFGISTLSYFDRKLIGELEFYRFSLSEIWFPARPMLPSSSGVGKMGRGRDWRTVTVGGGLPFMMSALRGKVGYLQKQT